MSTPAEKCLGELLRFLPHRRFTKVQETVIPALFTNDCNCLVAAPTGSGKTLLLEVAMLRLFRNILMPRDDAYAETAPQNGDGGSHAGRPQRRRQKAVYICPIKALANEKFDHWQAQFPTLTVVIETGDQHQHRMDQQEHSSSPSAGPGDARARNGLENMACVSGADILVTTPERWDSITRRWKEKEVMAIVNSVGLLLLDEVHTVQEERGAAMEAIVSRVKVIQASSSNAHQDPATGATLTRIIAISGTLPNCGDLAEWLEVSPEMTFTFSASDRPVPLTIRVIGYAHDSPNPFAFHRFLSFKIFPLMQQFSQGRPALVFCASRKDATSSAQRIAEDIREAAERQGKSAQLKPSAEVQLLVQQAGDKQLRSCLMIGVGFHHAAMTKEDRGLVERMFREQYIAVICATTTLALGVNLPAHLVLVKGTTFFSSGQCQDMPVSEVMQMCGRAGRPGFDTHGMALVLTMQRNVHLYETLSSGAVTLTCVESHLHRHMIEHVNAEVALRTIHSFPSAMEWVKTTFFWIRLRKCPSHYGLIFENRAEELEFNAETFVEALMERVLRVLVEEGCVHVSHANAGELCCAREATLRVTAGDVDCTTLPSAVFEATRLGRAMSRMYILFDTVCTFNAKLRDLGLASTVDGTPGDQSGGSARPAAADNREETTTRAGIIPVLEAPGHVDAKKLTLPGGVQLQNDANGATAATTPQLRPFTLRDVLQLLCHCQELLEVRLRQGDRGPLNELNKAVKYPLQSGRRGGREVREDWQKAYVLIQAHIGLLPLMEVSLRNDSLRLWAVVPRVSRFLEEYAWAATTSYSLALHSNVLARCIERRVWPDGLVLRQLKEVSDSVAKALLRSGLRTFENVTSVDARQLEVLCSRLPPFGTEVLCEAQRLPWISLDISFPTLAPNTEGPSNRRRVASGVVQLTLSRRAEAAPDDGLLGAVRGPFSVATLSRSAGGSSQLHHHRYAQDSMRVLLLVGIPSEDRVLLRRFVPLSAFSSQRATCGASAMASTAPADTQSPLTLSFPFLCPPCPSHPSSRGGTCRRIEARCLVLHVVGMDSVTARDEQLADDHDVETSEHVHDLAQKSPTDTCFPGPPNVASLHTSSQQTVLSAQVAAEARATFNDLIVDLKCIASAGERSKHHHTACRQVSTSHKRTRSDTGACLAAHDSRVALEKEEHRENNITAARVLPAAVVTTTFSPTVPDSAGVDYTDGNAAAAPAAAGMSPEQAAGEDSTLYSPEQCPGQAAQLTEPLREEIPQHAGVVPSTPVQGSPSPRSVEFRSSRRGEATEPLAASARSPPHKRVARVCLQRCSSPPASRPPAATDTWSRGCFPTLQTKVADATPQGHPWMPVQPQRYCDRPMFATPSGNEARRYPEGYMTWWRGQWHPPMVALAPAYSSHTMACVPPSHTSASQLDRDHPHINARERHDVLNQQKALYYPVNTHQTHLNTRYGVGGVQGQWSQLGRVEESTWMHGALAFAHQDPYYLPSTMAQTGNYGATVAESNSRHRPAGWEQVIATSTSRFAPQQTASLFPARASNESTREHQQTWQTHLPLSPSPPSCVYSASMPHQRSSSNPYSALETQPWSYPPLLPIYAQREWPPSGPMQPESTSLSLWMPSTHARQPQRPPMINSNLDTRQVPTNTAGRRVNPSAALSDLVRPSDTVYLPRHIRCPPTMAAQSWWQ
ncbi:hypothetical protein JKF63_02502 [Porcisia hertigi]|uniref:DNA 3'-5' helicase n=1 Tax=Porcisia hertigi TaxID=2761500 RepID=A0A836HN76_9TRYP|nr:hypothetical protein JKF63_02502 [Porcisia hertigi]